MRRSSIRLATNGQGQVCVPVPRDTYAVLAVVLDLTVALMATRWGDVEVDLAAARVAT